MNDGELIAHNISNEDDILNSKYLNRNAIESRDYQLNIATKCIRNNYLVIIPTGLGKTIIAVLVTAKTLELYPDDFKIIIMAPTKPLIVQHAQSFADLLNTNIYKENNSIQSQKLEQKSLQESNQIQNYVLTGSIDPKERAKIFLNSRILYYTPQTLRNDLLKKRYDLKKVALIVFDEAHRASGDYAYCDIAALYKEMNSDGNVLALTASPGFNKEKIDTLCKNLNIPIKNIEMRDRNDVDVKPFLHEMKIFKIGVKMNNLMSEILENLGDLSKEKLTLLSHLGLIYLNQENIRKMTQKSLVKLNKDILTKIKEMKNTPVRERAENDKNLYTALSINAEAMRIMHMFNLAETQGLDILLNYFLDIRKEAVKPKVSKAVQNLTTHPIYIKILNRLISMKTINVELLTHPKFFKLRDILEQQFKQDSNSRVLVFTQLRNTARNLTDRLNKIQGFNAIRFVGQTTKSNSDKGLTQKKQIEIIDKFKQGTYNILVSTNVAEEGLDIAECDLVVFYDTVASEIRLIQRRGRTARKRNGKVIILYCIGTSDEKYLNISMQRLKKMHNILEKNRISNPVNKPPKRKKNQKLVELQQHQQFQKICFDKISSNPKSNIKNDDEKKIIKIDGQIPYLHRFYELFSSLDYIIEKEDIADKSMRFLKPDITLKDILIITLVKPEDIERILFLTNLNKNLKIKEEILGEIENFKRNWRIGMIFINFIDQKGYNLVEKRQLIKLYEEFTKITQIEVIPIDSLEDMFIILSSLLKSIEKKR